VYSYTPLVFQVPDRHFSCCSWAAASASATAG